MALPARGSEVLARFKKSASFADADAGAYQAYHFYSESLDPGVGLEPDEELGGSDRHNANDPTQPTEGLANPAGPMRVPLDLNQIGYWLASALGGLTSTEDDGVYTHAGASGKDEVGLMHHELVNFAGYYRIASAFAVTGFTIPLEPVGGFRVIDLTTIGRSVVRRPTALSTSILASPARAKAQGYRGLVKIDGVEADNILGGSFSFSNNAQTERYLKDTKWPGGIVMGTPTASLSPRVRVRKDVVSAWLSKFDGVTPFTAEYLLPFAPNVSLSLKLSNCVAPQIEAVPNGSGLYEIAPQITASQKRDPADPLPMLSATLINAIVSY